MAQYQETNYWDDGDIAELQDLITLQDQKRKKMANKLIASILNNLRHLPGYNVSPLFIDVPECVIRNNNCNTCFRVELNKDGNILITNLLDTSTSIVNTFEKLMSRII